MPIALDGMVIEPGDLILGDDDGVLCVPFADTAAILKEASKKHADEERSIAAIRGGTRSKAWVDQTLERLGCFIENMTALRVLVTGASLAAEARAILEGIGAAVVLMPSGTGRDAIVRALAEAPTQAILMRGNPPIDGAVMDAAPELRVIAKHGAGVDSVDLSAATQRGIKVMVAADANAPAVAEHTLALIFALGRDIVDPGRTNPRRCVGSRGLQRTRDFRPPARPCRLRTHRPAGCGQGARGRDGCDRAAAPAGWCGCCACTRGHARWIRCWQIPTSSACTCR